MPKTINPQEMNVDELPGIWSPVQWEMTPEERVKEVEEQATASLLYAVDIPESILRLLIGETEIGRVLDPPKGYDSEQQGSWDTSLVTFAFKRPIQLIEVRREEDYLYAVYDFLGLGRWSIEITPESTAVRHL
jgi:hypothetical protein